MLSIHEVLEGYDISEETYEECLSTISDKVHGITDISWSDIVEMYNLPLHEDSLRKGSSGQLFGWVAVLDFLKEKDKSLSEYDQLVKLRIEKQKMFDYRNAFMKEIRSEARKEEIDNIVEDAIKSGALPRLETEVRQIESGNKKTLLVSLTDMHYGAGIDNRWNKYNPEICRQRLSEYTSYIIKVMKNTGADECVVWNNGDTISGNIHHSIALSNKENVIQQTMHASELIAEFLATLGIYFKKVSYVSVSGNHSRIEPNKDKEVLSDRLDDMVAWYINARLKDCKNVVIREDCRIDDTMYSINVLGKNYVGVHGDFDVRESRLYALQSLVGESVYAVLMGHMHHNKIESIHGLKLVMAGSLQGMDEYCVQKRLFGKPEQLICLCTENGIESYYPIEF